MIFTWTSSDCDVADANWGMIIAEIPQAKRVLGEHSQARLKALATHRLLVFEEYQPSDPSLGFLLRTAPAANHFQLHHS
jgi:hypothetical protein